MNRGRMKTWRRKTSQRGRREKMIGGRIEETGRIKMTWRRVKMTGRRIEASWRGKEIRRDEFKHISLRNGQLRNELWSRYYAKCSGCNFHAWIDSTGNSKCRARYINTSVFTRRRIDWPINSSCCITTSLTLTESVCVKEWLTKRFWSLKPSCSNPSLKYSDRSVFMITLRRSCKLISCLAIVTKNQCCWSGRSRFPSCFTSRTKSWNWKWLTIASNKPWRSCLTLSIT